MKKTSNFFKRVCRILGIIIIVFSVLSLIVYKQNLRIREKNINVAKEKFERLSNHNPKIELKSIKESDLPPSNKNSNKEIGYIDIEKEKILLPIFKSTSSEELRDGVGLVEGTDFPSSNLGTTSVIAGHRGGYNGEQSFLHIDRLEKGDKINISTINEKLQYKVVEKKIIKNDDWSHFYKEKNKSKLILMTCHPYPTNKERLLVISELENSIKK